MHQQYPNAYRKNCVPVRVVYLARCEVCGYPCNGFFYLCTNQTWHASDLSTLCRVFSASRKVCGNPCGWFFFIYFHFCKFYAILIENALYFCPIK